MADAASEDEAADLSRKALGAGCDDEPEGMAQTAAVLVHVPQSPAAGERLGDSGATHDAAESEASSIARRVSGATFEVLEEDDFWSGFWSDCDLVIAFKKLMKEQFGVKGWRHGYSALVYLSRERELLAACSGSSLTTKRSASTARRSRRANCSAAGALAGGWSRSSSGTPPIPGPTASNES